MFESGINEESRALERYLNNSKIGGLGGNFKVFHFDSIVSTQTMAKEMAVAGFPEDVLVIAREQTGGYGRKGDAWHSGLGGLWFSLLWKPKFAPSTASSLSIACAQALERALKRQVPGVYFQVKEPNDILTRLSDGSLKKVCGIILEGSVQNDAYEWLIGGVGINVNNKLPQELSSIAATLEQVSGRPVPRMPLWREVIKELGAARRFFDNNQ